MPLTKREIFELKYMEYNVLATFCRHVHRTTFVDKTHFRKTKVILEFPEISWFLGRPKKGVLKSPSRKRAT